MLHHNPHPRRNAIADDENLRDSEDFNKYLSDKINLLLHGHTLSSKSDWLDNKIPILSTGSAALKQAERPPETFNQYQILQIFSDKLIQHGRHYQLSSKKWIGDNSISKNGDTWQIAHPIQADNPLKITHERTLSKKSIRHLQDDFLAKIEAICRIKYPEPDVERILGIEPELDYFRITRKSDNISLCHLVGGSERSFNEQIFNHFLEAHQRYQESDPGTVSEFIYGGEPVPEQTINEYYANCRIKLISFIDFQGLIDFRPYLKTQTQQLINDSRYPAKLYVPQRMIYTIGYDDEQENRDVLNTVRGWLNEPHGRFILVLGDFGTGKTFLLRELARQIATENQALRNSPETRSVFLGCGD